MADYLPPVISKLTGDIDDFLAKIEEAKAAFESLDGMTVHLNIEIDPADLAAKVKTAAAATDLNIPLKINIDQASLAKAMATRALLEKPINANVNYNVNAPVVRSAAAGAAAGAAGAGGAGVAGALLTGGFLWGLTWQQIHLLIDAMVELAAVVVPAAAAFGAFGAAAVPTAQDIYNHLKAVYTVTQATGQNLAPLSGQFTKIAASVQPQVYELYGAALDIVNQKTSEFGQLALTGGNVLDMFAAKMVVAMHNSGGAVDEFLKNAGTDLSELIQIFGNVAAAIGHFISDMPGFADVFLRGAQALSYFLLDISRLPAPLLTTGFAIHGLYLYGGLALGVLTSLTNGLAKMTGGAAAAEQGAGKIRAFTIAVAGLGSNIAAIPGKISTWAASMIDAGGAAEDAGIGASILSGAMGVLASIPVWGWVAAGVIALGGLVYWLSQSKTATQEWLSSLQNGIASASIYTLASSAQSAYTKTTDALILAQNQLAQTSQYVNSVNLHTGDTISKVNPAYTQLQQKIQELTTGQQQFAAENTKIGMAMGELGTKYGLTAAGVESLTVQLTGSQKAAGQLWQSYLQGKLSLQQLVQEYTDYFSAVTSLDAGTLAQKADLFALQLQTNSTATAVNNLNKAWDAFLGLSENLVTAQIGLEGQLATLSTDAKAVHATFTGVNSASQALQNTFEAQLFPSVENVVNGMKQAHAPASALATVLATDLNPAVRDGVLANKAFAQQIYDVAVRAGYTGPDSIGPLTRWFNQNASSAQNAANQVNQYGGALARIPANQTKTVTFAVREQVTQALLGPNYGLGVIPGHAQGYRVPGYGGGDTHPALLEGGETVVPKHLTHLVAPLMRAHGVPGFASGGLVGSPGTSGSEGQQITIENKIYLDGKQLFGAVKSQSHTYNRRNGITVTGKLAPGR